jgi:hypothetical protein
VAWSGLIRPPQLQHSDTDAGIQRTATWLELFFDLAFLLVVAELAVGLRNDLTPTASWCSLGCSSVFSQAIDDHAVATHISASASSEQRSDSTRFRNVLYAPWKCSAAALVVGVAEVDAQIGDLDAQVVRFEIADPGVVQDVEGGESEASISGAESWELLFEPRDGPCLVAVVLP